MTVQIESIDVVSWAVTASMESGLSATIEVANKDSNYYNDEYLHKLITLKANVNDVEKTVFKGIIVGYDPSYELAAKHNLAFSCVSLFNRLERRPINTEKYDEVSFSDITTDILVQYCGYDASTFDLTYGTPDSPFTNMCVNEPSTIEALKKLAQASYQELFVNLEGKLITQQYTDLVETPLLEVTLAPEYIYAAKITRTDEIAFSTVRVRGAYKVATVQPPAIDAPTSIFNTFSNPYPQVEVIYPIIVSAPAECFENAAITSTDPNFISGVVSNVVNLNGARLLTIQLNVDAPLLLVGTHDLILRIEPAEAEIVSQKALGTQLTNIAKGTTRHNNKKAAWENHPQRTKGSIEFRGMKPVDEKEVDRYDVVVQDTSLHAMIGTLWTELDNVYIPSEAFCTLIGERYLTEYKQNRKIWEINFAPDLSLELNCRLTFSVPDSPLTVVGVVRDLNFNYTAENNSLLMSAKVEELPS